MFIELNIIIDSVTLDKSDIFNLLQSLLFCQYTFFLKAKKEPGHIGSAFLISPR